MVEEGKRVSHHTEKCHFLGLFWDLERAGSKNVFPRPFAREKIRSHKELPNTKNFLRTGWEPTYSNICTLSGDTNLLTMILNIGPISEQVLCFKEVCSVSGEPSTNFEMPQQATKHLLA